MAIKKEMKAWAIKVNGRSFCLDDYKLPIIFSRKAAAEVYINFIDNKHLWHVSKPVRVKIKVEEV